MELRAEMTTPPTGAGPADPGRAAGSLESSPWAPLRQPIFAALWVGVLISGMGTWMQTVGAQWLLVDAPNAAALVALVQAANTLPVMLLAMPAGVLADSFDKRWLLFAVQGYFLVAGVALLVLTLAGAMPPSLLLVFTFLLGAGAAVQLPAWQASTPELVPRHQIRSAARLEMVGINVSRAAGPALAGWVIAQGGVSTVFALNAVSVVPLGVALLFWHRSRPHGPHGRSGSGRPSGRAAATCGTTPRSTDHDPAGGVPAAGVGDVGAAAVDRDPTAPRRARAATG